MADFGVWPFIALACALSLIGLGAIATGRVGFARHIACAALVFMGSFLALAAFSAQSGFREGAVVMLGVFAGFSAHLIAGLVLSAMHRKSHPPHRRG